MRLEEAQQASSDGVAVKGNPVMRDIVWPAGLPHALAFLGHGSDFKGWPGYVAWPPNPENVPLWRDADWWEPLNPRTRQRT